MSYHVWLVSTTGGNFSMLSDECDTIEKARDSLVERFQGRFISVKPREISPPLAPISTKEGSKENGN